MELEYEISYGTKARRKLTMFSEVIGSLAVSLVNLQIAWFLIAILSNNFRSDTKTSNNIAAVIYTIIFIIWIASAIYLMVIPFIHKKVILNDFFCESKKK